MSSLNSFTASENLPPVGGPGEPNDFDAGDFSLEELAAQVLQVIPANGLAIALKDAGEFVCCASAGSAPKLGTVIEAGVGSCGECIEQRRVVVDQEMKGTLGSLVAIPIIKGNEVLGCVAAFSEHQNAFRELDIEQLVAMAYHLGSREKTARHESVIAEPVKVEKASPEMLVFAQDEERPGRYAEILKEELHTPIQDVVDGTPRYDEVHFRTFEAVNEERSRTVLIALAITAVVLIFLILAIYNRSI